eukprot:Tbor_TRINITY_DN5231_c2_g2::TRINITY_DN5231_c2_g2_i11::g.16527::m.16527/K02728/PSMA4; 20S proteasome subunit alpha 3
MSSRYDSRTTTFSPEGRLYQVEYAVEAIRQAGSAIAVLTKEGIVLATEKRSSHPLLDSENLKAKHISGEKLYQLASHIGCAVAGVNSDANILIQYARATAHRYEYQYQRELPVEDLARGLCDLKQGYTQYGGVRPFGVAFLIAGWDNYYGYQLYHSDPSGNYSAWYSYAIGEGDATAQSFLKQQWRSDCTLEEGIIMGINALQRTVDITNLNTERIEIATLTRGEVCLSEDGSNNINVKLNNNNNNNNKLIDDILDHEGSAVDSGTRFTILQKSVLEPLLKKAEEVRLKEETEKKIEREKRQDV